MYLSKVRICDTRIRNPYEVHRLLWQLFPGQETASRHFLFRTEKKDRASADILLQSVEPPVGQAHVMVLGSKTFNPILATGQRLRFKLAANAIKTIKDERKRKNSRHEIKQCRVPLIHEEEQHQWLARKLGPAAQLEAVLIQQRESLFFRRKRQPGKLVVLTFEGVLEVAEPNALMMLLNTGVGPAKSFGCGLLSLARMQ